MATFTFEIELEDVDPMVTRTIKMSSDSSLYLLHHVIQEAMGWKNYHLYKFEVGKLVITDRRLWDEDEMGPIIDVKMLSVADVFKKVGTSIKYEYDFGDGWMHRIKLVDTSTEPLLEVFPQVISGKNACPPEDCGGPHGYKELLLILKNPKHPEFYETLEWCGANFNPGKFDKVKINKVLGRLNIIIKEYEDGFKNN